MPNEEICPECQQPYTTTKPHYHGTEPARDSEERSSAARGWAALPWTGDRPKRRGWWAVRYTPKHHEIVQIGDLSGELNIFMNGSEAVFHVGHRYWDGALWAGPLFELDEDMSDATPPNVKAQVPHGPGGTPQ